MADRTNVGSPANFMSPDKTDLCLLMRATPARAQLTVSALSLS